MYYPLMINIVGKNVLIIGGGKVAFRKAKKFLEFGACIRIVGKKIIKDFYELKGNIDLIEDKYESKYIKDTLLVVCATSNKDVNEKAAQDCKNKNILCNVVDSIELSDFIVPSSVRRGDLIISVSTSGKSPLLSSKIRKELEEKYSMEYEEYIDLLGKIRDCVIKKYDDEKIKKDILKRTLNMSIYELREFYKAIRKGDKCMKIVVGSRGSRLALTQTNWVIDKLKSANPEVDFEVKIIKTKGDRIVDVALDKIGDKGLFVKEIEEQLLSGDIDMAIHSMKDMPSKLPEGLKFSHVPVREDYRDVIVFKEGYKAIDELPQGAIIGTGSKRRKYQLLKHRPDLNIVPIRGNVDTRIKKIDSENLHGTILAAAGLKRLGLHEDLKNRMQYLDQEILLPAPAQGILAIEIRKDSNEVDKIISSIHDENTEIQMIAERSFLEGVNGSCHIPVGAYCVVEREKIILTALLGTEDGEKLVKETLSGKKEEAREIGMKLAKIIAEEMN